MEMLKYRRLWSTVLHIPKDHRAQPRLLYPVKPSAIVEEKENMSRQRQQNEFQEWTPVAQEIIQELIHGITWNQKASTQHRK